MNRALILKQQTLCLQNSAIILNAKNDLVEFAKIVHDILNCIDTIETGKTTQVPYPLYLQTPNTQIQQLKRFEQASKEASNTTINPELFNAISRFQKDLITGYNQIHSNTKSILSTFISKMNPAISKTIETNFNALSPINPTINFKRLNDQFKLILKQIHSTIMLAITDRINDHLIFQDHMQSILSNLFDEFPYCLSPTLYSQSLTIHKELKAACDENALLTQKAMADASPSLLKQAIEHWSETHQNQNELYQLLNASLEAMKKLLTKDLIKTCQQLIKKLDATKRHLKRIKLLDKDWKTTYQKKIDFLKKTTSHSPHDLLQDTLFLDISKTKKSILENLTLAKLQEKNFLINYRFTNYFIIEKNEFLNDPNLQDKAYSGLKSLQHQIHACQELIHQPMSALAFDQPKPLDKNKWLRKSDYGDLLFLLAEIKTSEIKNALATKARLYQYFVEQLAQQAYKLHLRWDDKVYLLVRKQRIIEFYHQWQRVLKHTIESIRNEKEQTPWTSLPKIYALLTYDKKTFFSHQLKSDNAVPLFQSLMDLLNKKPHLKDPLQALSYFNQQKHEIKQQIEQQKKELTNDHALWEYFYALTFNTLTHQTTFVVGSYLYDLCMENLEHIKNTTHLRRTYSEAVDDFGNRWIPSWIASYLSPARDTKIMHYVTGFSALIVDHYLAFSMHYTYRAYSAISGIVFSRFDFWVDTGEKVDAIIQPLTDKLHDLTPSCFQPISQFIRHHCQTDEIAFVEKEAMLHWLLGLGLNTIMQRRQHIVPSMLGYITATSLNAATNRTIDSRAIHKESNPKFAVVVKYFVNLNTYRHAYSAGFMLAYNVLQPETFDNEEEPPTDQPSKKMTQARALSIFGFNTYPSLTELKKKRRHLGLEYHQDKCQSKCTSSTMMFFAKPGISDTIPKVEKTKTSCIEQCKLDSHEKMTEINVAYDFLTK